MTKSAGGSVTSGTLNSGGAQGPARSHPDSAGGGDGGHGRLPPGLHRRDERLGHDVNDPEPEPYLEGPDLTWMWYDGAPLLRRWCKRRGYHLWIEPLNYPAEVLRKCRTCGAQCRMSRPVHCPGCEVTLDESDVYGQMEHMTRKHPDIIKERRAEARRWEGWEND
jgi:hypothetical protein